MMSCATITFTSRHGVRACVCVLAANQTRKESPSNPNTRRERDGAKVGNVDDDRVLILLCCNYDD